jgi:hypothetical protein
VKPIFMTLVVLLLTLMMVQPAEATSSSIMASAAEAPEADLVDDVSGQRLAETISALSGFSTRAFYTDDCRNASIYIFDRFNDLGLGVYYQ